MNFQRTTLSIAFIIFIIYCLTLVILVYRPIKKWPPEIGDCPDLWLSVGDKSANMKCQPNSKLKPGLGNWGNFCQKQNNEIYNCQVVDFSGPEYNSKNQKCGWARSHNIFWSGITTGGTLENEKGDGNYCDYKLSQNDLKDTQ